MSTKTATTIVNHVNPDRLLNLESFYGFQKKTHKGSITRPCAATIAALHLLSKSPDPVSFDDINDTVYRSWGFTIDKRKSNAPKAHSYLERNKTPKGGVQLDQRLRGYLTGDHARIACFDERLAGFYSIDPVERTVSRSKLFADHVSSKRISSARKISARAKAAVQTRKTILRKAE